MDVLLDGSDRSRLVLRYVGAEEVDPAGAASRCGSANLVGAKPAAVSRCILAPAWRRQIPATFAKVHLTARQADQQMLQRLGLIGLLQDRTS